MDLTITVAVPNSSSRWLLERHASDDFNETSTQLAYGLPTRLLPTIIRSSFQSLASSPFSPQHTLSVMAMSCRYAARACARQLRSSPSQIQSIRVASMTRRYNSTEAEAPTNPKIAGIVDQISQLTLLETADLVSSLKVRSTSTQRRQDSSTDNHHRASSTSPTCR